MTRTEPSVNSAATPNSSGITVIIVGLGIAGLAAAIECHRKGHTVIGLEKRPEIAHTGDIIGIGRNGARVIQGWGHGSVERKLNDIRCQIDVIQGFDEAGVLQDTKTMDGYKPGDGYVGGRADIVLSMYDHARSLGLDMRLGVDVTGYWEDETSAGVIVDGTRIVGDCVVASDGIHSQARAIITGDTTTPGVTGSTTYRSRFSSQELKDVPAAQWLLQGTDKSDKMYHFIGKGVMVLMATGRNGRDVYWNMMVKCEGTFDDSLSWLQAADVREALSYISLWPIKDNLSAVIERTPPGECFNHPALVSAPLQRWTSKGGRMILIGDAAHPVLPTTGQGANQSLEDSAVLAICLELGGKQRVPLGLRVMEKLRYKRTSLIQEGGLQMLKTLHEANWGAAHEEETPTIVARPGWIFRHDCQASTYHEFDKVVQAIESSCEYEPLNIPPDGCFKIIDEEEPIA